MKPSIFYRIASVLLVLFAFGHTVGFRQTAGMTGADAVVSLMKSVHFTVQGFPRVYYDFYVGFGLFASIFLVFSAILAWLLGGLSREVLGRILPIAWAFALCFLGITFLTWRYFFWVPFISATLVMLCLVIAAWLAGKQSERSPASRVH
jgi:hypothetical protein